MVAVAHDMRTRWVRAILNGSLIRSEAGSTTLEFAIAMPIVILLVIGTMVVMLGLLAFGNAVYATELAARYAALHSSTADAPATPQSITAEVQNRLWIGAQTSEVSATWSAGDVPGGSVTVVTAIALPIAIPFTDVHQLTVTASAVRVITR